MPRDKVNAYGTMRSSKGLKVPAPTAIKYSRGKLGESLILKYPEFNLLDPNMKMTDWTYNNLHDPYLKDFFQKPERKRLLRKQGLITKDDKVPCSQKEFNQYMNYTSDVVQSWEKFHLQQRNIQQRLEKCLLQNQNVQQSRKKPQKQKMAVQHRPRVSGVSSVAENVHDSPVPALEGSNYPGCPSLSSSKELSGDSLRLCSSSTEYLMQTAAEPTIKVDSPAIISTVRQESCSHADVNSQSRSGSFSGYSETSTNMMTLEPRDDVVASPRKALRKSSGKRAKEMSSLEVCVTTSNSEGPSSGLKKYSHKSSQTSRLDRDVETDLDFPSLPLFSPSSTTTFTKRVQDSAVPVPLDSLYHPALSSSAELSSDFFSLCSSSSEDMFQPVAEPTIKVLYSVDSPDLLSSSSEESCSPANSGSHTSEAKDEVAAALDLKSSHMSIVESYIDEVHGLSSLPLPSPSSRNIITEGDTIPSTSEGSKSFNIICHVSPSHLSMIGNDIVEYTMERSASALEHHGLLATQQTSDDSNGSSSLNSESASGSPCCVFAGPDSQNDPDSCYELTGGYYGKSSVTVVQSEMSLEAFTDKIVSGIQSLLVKGRGTPSTIEAVIADGNTEDTLAAAGTSAKQTPEVENTSAGSKSKKRVRAFFKRAWQAVKQTFVCGTRSDKIGPAV